MENKNFPSISQNINKNITANCYQLASTLNIEWMNRKQRQKWLMWNETHNRHIYLQHRGNFINNPILLLCIVNIREGIYYSPMRYHCQLNCSNYSLHKKSKFCKNGGGNAMKFAISHKTLKFGELMAKTLNNRKYLSNSKYRCCLSQFLNKPFIPYLVVFFSL